jgi:hypothetical protein
MWEVHFVTLEADLFYKLVAVKLALLSTSTLLYSSQWYRTLTLLLTSGIAVGCLLKYGTVLK